MVRSVCYTAEGVGESKRSGNNLCLGSGCTDKRVVLAQGQSAFNNTPPCRKCFRALIRIPNIASSWSTELFLRWPVMHGPMLRLGCSMGLHDLCHVFLKTPMSRTCSSSIRRSLICNNSRIFLSLLASLGSTLGRQSATSDSPGRCSSRMGAVF